MPLATHLSTTRTPRDLCITSCLTPASNSVRETRLTLRSELYPYYFVPPTQFSHNLNLLSLPRKQTLGHARLVSGAWRRFHLPAGSTGVLAWPHGRYNASTLNQSSGPSHHTTHTPLHCVSMIVAIPQNWLCEYNSSTDGRESTMCDVNTGLCGKNTSACPCHRLSLIHI